MGTMTRLLCRWLAGKAQKSLVQAAHLVIWGSKNRADLVASKAVEPASVGAFSSSVAVGWALPVARAEPFQTFPQAEILGKPSRFKPVSIRWLAMPYKQPVSKRILHMRTARFNGCSFPNPNVHGR